MTASKDGHHFASAGFAGDVKLWRSEEGQWTEKGEIVGAISIFERILSTSA